MIFFFFLQYNRLEIQLLIKNTLTIQRLIIKNFLETVEGLCNCINGGLNSTGSWERKNKKIHPLFLIALIVIVARKVLKNLWHTTSIHYKAEFNFKGTFFTLFCCVIVRVNMKVKNDFDGFEANQPIIFKILFCTHIHFAHTSTGIQLGTEIYATPIIHPTFTPLFINNK